jgi:hypothetical protein
MCSKRSFWNCIKWNKINAFIFKYKAHLVKIKAHLEDCLIKFLIKNY